jgi:hypothetical protein
MQVKMSWQKKRWKASQMQELPTKQMISNKKYYNASNTVLL